MDEKKKTRKEKKVSLNSRKRKEEMEDKEEN